MSPRILVACALAAAVPALAAPYYSTTGMIYNLRYDAATGRAVYDTHLDEMDRYGILPGVLAMTDAPDGAPLHGYQLTAMALGSVLDEAQRRTGQRRIVLDLFHLFFKSVPYTSAVACTGYSAPVTNPPAPLVTEPKRQLVNARAELRIADANGNGIADYRDRMNDFMSRLPPGVNASNFVFISVNPESGCVPAADIDAAARAVKAALPGVQVAAGYPISMDSRAEINIAHGTNHNGRFPTSLDRIITWSYGVMNPADDMDPLNARDTRWPGFSYYYAKLVNEKLQPWQTIDWVIDGHYIPGRHGVFATAVAPPPGWTLGAPHARAVSNWCTWIRGQARANGMLAFTYGGSPDSEFYGIAEMPQIVRDTHANISVGACAALERPLAADSFTPRQAGGALNGTALNSRVTEEGGVAWISNTATVRLVGVTDPTRYGDGHATSAAGTNPRAVVPVVGAGTRPLIVTADIDPANSEWTAIGLTGAPAQGWFGTGQLWVYLKNSGRYNVLANGTAISLTGGERFDARVLPNTLNRVELFYNRTLRSVSLRINGHQVLAPTTLPAGFDPVTTYAGWSALTVVGNGPRVDSFELRRR